MELLKYNNGFINPPARPPLPPKKLFSTSPPHSNRPLVRTFKLTNKGRRLQQLVWVTDGFVPLSKAKKDKLKASNATNPKKVC